MDFDVNEGREDLIYYSVLPWIHFTGLTHAHRIPRTGDSVPRIVFGKHRPQNERVDMPISVEVHHALMDGVHVAKFLDTLQGFIDSCSQILGLNPRLRFSPEYFHELFFPSIIFIS